MNPLIVSETIEQARLKVARAKHHIVEAHEIYNEYLQSDFYSLSIKEVGSLGDHLLVVSCRPISPGLPLAVGDAFHCLSSALDYLMTGLMRGNKGATTRVTFPSHDEKRSLEQSFCPPKAGKTASVNNKLAVAFPWLPEICIDTLQTYKGGRLSLWEIRKADNIDKHNFILLTNNVTKLSDVTIKSADGRMAFNNENFYFEDGAASSFMAVSAKLVVTEGGYATSTITFGPRSEVFAGQHLFTTLVRCSESVSEAIDIMAARL